MQPNLIDMYSINNDIKKYHFTNNSLIINVLIVAFIVFIMFIIYISKSPYTKQQKKENTINTLNYILEKSNLEIEKQRELNKII
tara:strand:- start:1486 stop:1737 length:252 start_codon:yes stop_codon:yes gene_type:complete